MRTVIILLLATVLCVATANAQKQPATVKNAFNKSYPDATSVKWDEEDGKYEASFKRNGKDMSVTYNSNGTVDETETAITVSELPKKAGDYARTKGAIKEASKIVSGNGIIMYEAEVKGTDLLFDSKGNFIKEKKDNEDKE